MTKCFEIPCVMDVKVGCVTYDKFADDDKQQREIAKCPALKDLNFQLIGIKVLLEDLISELSLIINKFSLRFRDFTRYQL